MFRFIYFVTFLIWKFTRVSHGLIGSFFGSFVSGWHWLVSAGTKASTTSTLFFSSGLKLFCKFCATLVWAWMQSRLKANYIIQSIIYTTLYSLEPTGRDALKWMDDQWVTGEIKPNDSFLVLIQWTTNESRHVFQRVASCTVYRIVLVTWR